MAERETVELLDTLFGAIGRRDLDAVADLYTDDIEVWHNVTGVALNPRNMIVLKNVEVRR